MTEPNNYVGTYTRKKSTKNIFLSIFKYNIVSYKHVIYRINIELIYFKDKSYKKTNYIC